MHFTYNEPDNRGLKQGDILRKTPELIALIREVHPHYANEDYRYFQVLTQTCDLVRRAGACKSRYITLAAARPLDLIVQRTVETFSDRTLFDERICCSSKHRRALEDLFNKLLNNNDPYHFFLQAAPEYGLDIPCCTQLHLSISIRAYQHYDTCLGAKILELCENFRAKLGWAVGNLYSRVGTEDYVPGALPDHKTYEDYIADLINGYVIWIPETDFPVFKKRMKHAVNFGELAEGVERERERARETKLNVLAAAISKPLGIDDDKKKMVKNILSQHPLLKQILS